MDRSQGQKFVLYPKKKLERMPIQGDVRLLSVLTMTWECARNRRMWVRARWTALNFRPFMCQVRYLPDQKPQASFPSKTAPHPELHPHFYHLAMADYPIHSPLWRKLGSCHTNGAFPLHGTARYGSVRFTFGGFSTGYCTWYLILF